MGFSEEDKKNLIYRYSERYRQFGYSPKALGWDKGKQDVRFEILTSLFSFHQKHVLDIGCGFGDLLHTLSGKYKEFLYTGIDLVPEFIEEARIRHPEDNCNFLLGNILDFLPEQSFDFAIASGIFNHILEGNNNYSFIEEVMTKTLSISRDGLAFDFLSDKVDYRLDHTFHSKPEKILELAYGFSRNIVLRNDYMPFEFSIFIFKNDHFSKEDTLFTYFKNKK